jgi:hypothetical protein
MKGPTMTTLVSRSLAIVALLVATITLGGTARAATPTLEIVNMTTHTATILAHRAGLLYGRYSIPPYGKALIYGDGVFTFSGILSGGELPRRDTTLVAGAQTRGLIIEVRGTTFTWTFGQATSGTIM